jgi:hypothetical protein
MVEVLFTAASLDHPCSVGALKVEHVVEPVDKHVLTERWEYFVWSHWEPRGIW